MRIIFFGTPDYVSPIITALHKNFSDETNSPIVAVVTQNPKPVGRKQLLEYSAVDTWAYKHKIPVFYNANALLTKGFKADLGIVASYGSLLPPGIVKSFPHGTLVIHPSLLPFFRWSSPVQAAIITNSNPTGVTIIKMDEKFDHGPIVAQFKEDVMPQDTTETLRARLFERSAQVLVDLIPAYLSGKIHLKEQDHKKASFAQSIKKEDAFIPPQYIQNALNGKSAKEEWKINFIKDYSAKPDAIFLERFIRAMNPWPVAWTCINLSTTEGQTKRIKILKAHIEEEINPSTNKQVCKLVPNEIQLEGKNPVFWKQFVKAYSLFSFKK